MTDRDAIRAYYASFGELEWDRLARPADGAVEHAVTTAALDRHLRPASDILDVGGGPGRYAIRLAEQGHRVTLADLSPELLAIARDRIAAAGVTLVDVVEADACDLSRWEASSFDAVLCLGPLYHLISQREREAAVGEVRRVLRPDGIVLAAVIPRLAYLERTIALRDERHHLLDRAWLRRLLEEGVFENEVPGRFSLGYGFRPGEAEQLFRAHGFEAVELLSAESLSAGISAQVGEVLEEGGAMADAALRLMVELAAEPSLLGAARHQLFVGRKT